MSIRDDPRVNAASWPVAVALAHEHKAAYARERGAIKALLRLVTGKCELQRILEDNDYCSTRLSRAVTKSLVLSRALSRARAEAVDEATRGSFDAGAAAGRVTQAKGLASAAAAAGAPRLDAEARLRLCLEDVRVAGRCLDLLEAARRRKVDPAAEAARLERLWCALMPARRAHASGARAWTLLGFQGADPLTDLRGMGWLGLDVLVRLAESPARDGGALLQAALANFPELPLAIALINLEALALRLLQTRDLDHLFYRADVVGGSRRDEAWAREADEGHALQVYATLTGRMLARFLETWAKTKRNVMHFGLVLAQFESQQILEARLDARRGA